MERRAGSVLAAVLVGGMALAGCSSSVTKSPAASAVQSGLSAAASAAASGAASAASSLGSVAASAVASAEAAASSALASIKGGLDARSEVTLGPVTTGSGGKSEVPVTVTNGQSQSYRYTVQVNFDDPSGNLLDSVVVTVPDVGPGATAHAVARSNRSLSGTVTASVATALRY